MVNSDTTVVVNSDTTVVVNSDTTVVVNSDTTVVVNSDTTPHHCSTGIIVFKRDIQSEEQSVNTSRVYIVHCTVYTVQLQPVHANNTTHYKETLTTAL